MAGMVGVKVSYIHIFLLHLLRVISGLFEALAKHASSAMNSGVIVEASGHYRHCLSMVKSGPIGLCYCASDRFFSSCSHHLLSLRVCPQVFCH